MTKHLVLSFLMVSSNLMASNSSSVKDLIVKRLGGDSKESFCKLEGMNVYSGKLDRFNHKIHLQCLDIVLKGKGMYEAPGRWKENFKNSLSRVTEDWATSEKIVTQIFNELDNLISLRTYFISKANNNKLNFDTFCILQSAGAILEAKEAGMKHDQSYQQGIAACKKQFLPSQQKTIETNMKPEILSAIDGFVLHYKFNTNAKLDQILKGDFSAYKP